MWDTSLVERETEHTTAVSSGNPPAIPTVQGILSSFHCVIEKFQNKLVVMGGVDEVCVCVCVCMCVGKGGEKEGEEAGFGKSEAQIIMFYRVYTSR